MRLKDLPRVLFFVCISAAGVGGVVRAQGSPTKLAVDGQASLKVVVSDKASLRVRGAAATLAQHLGRMSGVKFESAIGDGRAGIAVGSFADFAAIALDGALAASARGYNQKLFRPNS